MFNPTMGENSGPACYVMGTLCRPSLSKHVSEQPSAVPTYEPRTRARPDTHGRSSLLETSICKKSYTEVDGSRVTDENAEDFYAYFPFDSSASSDQDISFPLPSSLNNGRIGCSGDSFDDSESDDEEPLESYYFGENRLRTEGHRGNSLAWVVNGDQSTGQRESAPRASSPHPWSPRERRPANRRHLRRSPCMRSRWLYEASAGSHRNMPRTGGHDCHDSSIWSYIPSPRHLTPAALAATDTLHSFEGHATSGDSDSHPLQHHLHHHSHYHNQSFAGSSVVNALLHQVLTTNLRAEPEEEQILGDVDATMARNGHDVQGIPWENLPFSREDYRASRLRDHGRREGGEAAEALRDIVKEPRRGASFFRFAANTRRVKCSIVHFQLRNLVWATTSHDVFLVHESNIVHWDAAARRRTQVLDLSGHTQSDGDGELSPNASLGSVQISTMIAKDDIVIAGGFFGEVVAKNVRTHVVEYNKRITYDENAITNAIDVFGSRVMTSNNDCYVRLFDLPSFTKLNEFRFLKAVNHATRQPDGKMVAVVGDDKPVHVMDGDNGEIIATLHGHEDFSFATGWHTGGRMFATGSQDRTCRVWDIRKTSQSLCVLGAHTGAMRSLRFSPCGQFLAMAEPRDFVHIYDVARGDFEQCQEIDLFGEIAGISMSPDSGALFIGMYDRNYGSLLEYERSGLMPSYLPCVLP